MKHPTWHLNIGSPQRAGAARFAPPADAKYPNQSFDGLAGFLILTPVRPRCKARDPAMDCEGLPALGRDDLAKYGLVPCPASKVRQHRGRARVFECDGLATPIKSLEPDTASGCSLPPNDVLADVDGANWANSWL